MLSWNPLLLVHTPIEKKIFFSEKTPDQSQSGARLQYIAMSESENGFGFNLLNQREFDARVTITSPVIAFLVKNHVASCVRAFKKLCNLREICPVQLNLYLSDCNSSCLDLWPQRFERAVLTPFAVDC